MVVVWPAVGVVGHKTRKEKKLHTRVWLRHGARLVGRPGGGTEFGINGMKGVETDGAA